MTAEARRPARPERARFLTAREMTVAACVAEGKANKQIAAELGIAEWTVKSHMTRIMRRVGVNDRAELTAILFRAGRLGLDTQWRVVIDPPRGHRLMVQTPTAGEFWFAGEPRSRADVLRLAGVTR